MAERRTFPDEKPIMHWTDGFPHDLHGWGPLAPDYGLDHQRDYAGEIASEESKHPYGDRFRTRLRSDDGYLVWRASRVKPQDH